MAWLNLWGKGGTGNQEELLHNNDEIREKGRSGLSKAAGRECVTVARLTSTDLGVPADGRGEKGIGKVLFSSLAGGWPTQVWHWNAHWPTF